MEEVEEARARCSELIGLVQTSNKEDKLTYLSELKEILLHRQPGLLDEFISPLLEFQVDTVTLVRKDVVDFIKEAGKNHPAHLQKFLTTLAYLVNDESGVVAKGVLLALCDLYRRGLKYVIQSSMGDAQAVWESLQTVKQAAITLLDASQDATRQNAIKLCRVIITGLSHPPEPTDSAQATVAEVPTPHKILNAKQLEAEGDALLAMLLDRLVNRAQHKVSPLVLVMLVTELRSLAISDGGRPQFVARVTKAVVAAAAMVSEAKKGWPDMKPSKSQVNTMSDACKRAMISLVDLPGTEPWYTEMAQRLMQFGAKEESKEIMRSISRKKRSAGEDPTTSGRDKRRRTSAAEGLTQGSKRSHEQVTAEASGSGRHDPRARVAAPSAGPEGSGTNGQFGAGDPWPPELSELMAETCREEAWLPTKVAEVLIANFANLPPKPDGPAPALGNEIANAIKPLAQLFQLTKAAVRVAPPPPPPPPALPAASDQDVSVNGDKQVAPYDPNPVKEAAHAAAALQRVLMSGGWLARLLAAAAGQEVSDGVMRLRAVLLTRMAGLLPDDGEAHGALVDYIKGNRTGRLRLALHWLYQAYREEAEEAAKVEALRLHRHGRYTRLFVSLMRLYLPQSEGGEGDDGATVEQEEGEGGEDDTGELLRNFLLGSPLLPYEEVGKELKALCLEQEGKHLFVGLSVLRDLVTNRPPCRKHLLRVALGLSVDQDETVRAAAITTVKNSLYSLPPLVEQVEAFASEQLNALKDQKGLPPKPPPLEGEEPADEGAAEKAQAEAEIRQQDEAKQRLLLYCHLCSRKHELLKGLATVYPHVQAIAKAEIDRQLPLLVRAMGPRSPPLQELLRDFPTLFPDPEVPPPLDFALRLVTALSDLPQAAKPQAPMAPREKLETDEERAEWDMEQARRAEELKRRELPSALLDAIVKLEESSGDARFLACVLPMLNKDDALASLPRIVAMEKAEIVCSAFERALSAASPPLTPAGLMVALHYVDLKEDLPEKLRLKRVITATGLCFEKRLRPFYTKEVLASVIQQMLDMPKDLPKLFMRTVIKSMSNYPDLKSFAMRVLAALIAKQVWKDNDQWKGFVMCCAEAGPASGPVLMQLPPTQLEEVLTMSPPLRHILDNHSKTLSTVPSAVSQALGKFAGK